MLIMTFSQHPPFRDQFLPELVRRRCQNFYSGRYTCTVDLDRKSKYLAAANQPGETLLYMIP